MKQYVKTCVKYLGMACLIGFTCISPAESTQTEIWTTESFEEFQQGEAQDVTLTQTGEITLAPELQEILTLQGSDLTVWALEEDSRGNVYVGTGEQGKIFKITPRGEVSLFFDSPEIGILSLAIDEQDNVYAGTTPDGLIYKIASDGTPSTFFMTEEAYVWALEFGANNILYAGTGESGKIFKLVPDGTGSVLYDSPQTHIMTLLFDPQGWLYAGTEGKGVTYKVDLEGQPFVLHQAQEDEVHSLALDSEGNLYMAAISNQVFPQPNSSKPQEQQQAPQDQGAKKSTIYQITPQGTVSTLVELPNYLVYSMICDEEDTLLVGTDDDGMLLRVLPNGEYHQLLTVEASNILALRKTAQKSLYLGTSDIGTVYQAGPGPIEEGTYLSEIHDVKTPATWGKIFWRGTAHPIQLFTRTGNTSIPDDTWSSWSEALLNNEGDAIPNPPARFIQWKAVLKLQDTDHPELEEVSVAYLPLNLAPQIESVFVFQGMQQQENSQQSQSSQHSSGGNSGSRRPPQPGNGKSQTPDVQTPKFVPPGYAAVMWNASDPNNEPLTYTVSLRGEQDPVWNVLEEDLETAEYALDTSTLPDGGYYVKVTASDRPANPPTHAIEVEKESERFEVDHTPPQVSIALNQEQKEGELDFTVIAQDEFSRLKDAAYAVDAGEWIPIFSEDQVIDSKDEKFSIILSDLSVGNHVLAFKATDRASNTGTVKLLFTIPENPPQNP